MYTKKEIIEKTKNMTLEQLVFFYNTAFGEDGFFTYLEHSTDTEAGQKPYYIWQDGYIRKLNKTETRNFILKHMTVQNLNLIEEGTFNGAKWLNNLCNETIQYV